MHETVVILGASTHPQRYAYKAQHALLKAGHTPVPVNPRYAYIDNIPCNPDLNSISRDIDTVTVYVRSDILETMVEDIIRLHPHRVILNPGTESEAATARLVSAGINVQQACTLVLLGAGRFNL
jgi:predicted CoA-binding protein